MKTVARAAAALATAVGIGLTGAIAGEAPAKADFIFDICPSGMDGVVSGTPTSCPFADSVRRGYFTQRDTWVVAYSPVTGGVYTMDCSYNNFVATLSNGRSHPGVLCTGGIGAAVVIW